MASASDYVKLIPSANQQPKFSAMVGLVAGSFADLTNVAKGLNENFDLDTAIGAQLDAIGIWIGLSRYVKTPLSGVYFSFDTAGLGFDQGSWQGPYDPSDGLTRLDDETYRTMLRAKIAANHWDGTQESYIAIMQKAFGSLGVSIAALDNQNMTMDVYFFGAIVPAVIVSLLQNGYLSMKPEGVHINGYHFNKVFGFDLNDAYVGGFDVGYLTSY